MLLSTQTNLFEFLDEASSFHTTLYIEADVHFDLSERVCQFDDGNLKTHILHTSERKKDKPDIVL